jgi:peptidyl-dipeptidase Dcp
MTMNPFFEVSTLPFQCPPFDRIADEHYRPAIDEGMRRQLIEIEAIAADPEPPTFANTIEAIERSGALLTRVSKVFFGLASANGSPEIRRIRADVAPLVAAHRDAIHLNAALFARVEALYARRGDLGLDREAEYLVERTYRRFVRAGAKLSADDQAALRALNREEATLTTAFRDKVLAETNAVAVVVEDRARLAGMSDGDLSAAAEAAKERGLEGAWVLTLQNTSQQPALSSLQDRQLRRLVMRASLERCARGTENDTRAIAERLSPRRAATARLLGFATYAEYVLDDQMAKTAAAAEALMTDLVPAAKARAEGEAERMRAYAGPDGTFELGPADWEFYAAKVREAEYDIDAAQVRPYFELDRVLRDGVFYAAERLYGVAFRERSDLPGYHPDVRVFDVLDADGSPLGLFLADLFARPSKDGGAWMNTFVDQNGLTGTKPVVYNVCNFAKPAPGQPVLLDWDSVRTLFHEFGHALHGIFSRTTFPSLSGTNVPRDFVEFPSQFNEHWALEPEVFASYARHHETGEPMPVELAERIRRASTFNVGYGTTEYLAAALLDLAWHSLPPGGPGREALAFEREALERYGLSVPQVPPRYRTTYFSHVWGGGYSAGYYAYLWAEVLDHDAYYWFKENGGMTRENGQRFREMVLSRGGTMDAAAMYRAFRGRDPIVEPLLIERGLKPPAGE